MRNTTAKRFDAATKYRMVSAAVISPENFTDHVIQVPVSRSIFSFPIALNRVLCQDLTATILSIAKNPDSLAATFRFEDTYIESPGRHPRTVVKLSFCHQREMKLATNVRQNRVVLVKTMHVSMAVEITHIYDQDQTIEEYLSVESSESAHL